MTHAFAGAVLAHATLPSGSRTATRRAAVALGIAAANAPDVDVLYTGLLTGDEPIGYLLHHRGHSHTLPGLIVLAAMLMLVLRWYRPARAALAWGSGRAAILVAAGLASHVLLDSANSYGSHLFYPLSSRWFYGEMIFVLEPWMWVIFGVPVALSATNRAWRTVAWLVALGLTLGVAYLGLVVPAVFAALLAGALGIAVVMRAWEPRRRALAALSLVVCLACVWAGLSRVARAETLRAGEHLEGTPLDLVIDPNAAAPWCWTVMLVERVPGGAALVARRGTVSIVPRLWPAARCATSRLAARTWASKGPASDAVVWHRQWTIDLEPLRALNETDCRARAWFQFGRVPYLDGRRLLDLRFENPLGDNFSAMRVDSQRTGCPPNLTEWTPPRADMLSR